MPARLRLAFSSLSLVFVFMPAAALYGELSRRSDIWWTPYALLVPLAESGDRVEVYARGKPFVALLQAGQVQVAEEGRSRTLVTNDVGLRFNNCDRVRAERLPLLLAYAAACGISACVLLLVLTGRLAYRGEGGAMGDGATSRGPEGESRP